ncbi:MAG TPA: hypothetical protein RMH99_18710, partial [Sandaracinaceae bacterium LLY-WYZ-13_1]|nr:hypothetical protein [Sandaracinaceae bacterium LLY-WYZ-13_1]
MSEVRLDQVLDRVPSGLPVGIGCWLVGRAANAIAARPRPLTPTEVRIRDDGGVRVAAPAQDELPFAHQAPEVIRGAAPTPRSAVFSLGALVVQTVTGRAPFARGSDLETRIAVVEEQIPPLLGRVAQASSGLDELVGRALAKAPEDRFASTVELAEELDAYLEAELLDVGPEELARVVRAALAGEDLWVEPGGAV